MTHNVCRLNFSFIFYVNFSTFKDFNFFHILIQKLALLIDLEIRSLIERNLYIKFQVLDYKKCTQHLKRIQGANREKTTSKKQETVAKKFN